MIDLSEFLLPSGRSNGNSELRNKTFLSITNGGNGNRQMCLKLGAKVSDEVVRYFGNTCRILVQPITGEIAVCRGNDRRLQRASHENPDTCRKVSLGSEIAAFEKHHGKFRRMFFDARWENDERGNKFLYLEPNGNMERDDAR